MSYAQCTLTMHNAYMLHEYVQMEALQPKPETFDQMETEQYLKIFAHETVCFRMTRVETKTFINLFSIFGR